MQLIIRIINAFFLKLLLDALGSCCEETNGIYVYLYKSLQLITRIINAFLNGIKFLNF